MEMRSDASSEERSDAENAEILRRTRRRGTPQGGASSEVPESAEVRNHASSDVRSDAENAEIGRQTDARQRAASQRGASSEVPDPAPPHVPVSARAMLTHEAVGA